MSTTHDQTGATSGPLASMLDETLGVVGLVWTSQRGEVLGVAGPRHEGLLGLVSFAIGAWELSARLGQAAGCGAQPEHLTMRYEDGDLLLLRVEHDETLVLAQTDRRSPLGAVLHDLSWQLKQLPATRWS